MMSPHSFSFVIGFLCFPVWLGGFCASGGLIARNRTAKRLNAASVTLFFLFLAAITVLLAIMLASEGRGRGGRGRDDRDCTYFYDPSRRTNQVICT
jgi:hypothetical protein